MRVVEILLPKGTSDRSISPRQAQHIDALQKRMDSYVDKIMDPRTSLQGREFLKSRLRDDYYDLKKAIGQFHAVAEAVHRVPITNDDFGAVKELMSRPIPAAVAMIYIEDCIMDDALNDEIRILEETDPGRDVRPLIAEWFERVMPDQMFHFVDDRAEGDLNQKRGLLSPIHGYDPHMYKGSQENVTGNNAYGFK
jgi:hypothetical protein